MANPWVLLAVVLGLVGAGVLGHHKGYSDAEGDAALQRQRDIVATWKAGQADLRRESERAQQAQRRADRLSRRLQEIERENPVPPRPDFRWSAAEFRLLESRREAFTAADREPAAGPLPGAVPGDAGDGPGPAEDGEGSAGLGFGLPGAAAGVPGLGGSATIHAAGEP